MDLQYIKKLNCIFTKKININYTLIPIFFNLRFYNQIIKRPSFFI